MNFELNKLVRPHILNLVPYSSAKDEYSGEASIFLDANENSLGSPLIKWYNRYPDPKQVALRNRLAEIKGVSADNIFVGNGSDEAIDLLYRIFCEPQVDNIIIHPPTYAMYEVSANVQGIEIRRANLLENFQLDLEKIESLIDAHTKIIWICSPNNPTGNSIYYQDIETILNNFDGIVVVDEAYINFARQKSMVTLLNEYPNLVVLQTLSKAWGLAALRVGMAFASKEIIQLLMKIKSPYNISEPVQDLALQALQNVETVNEMIKELVKQREWLEEELQQVPAVVHVYPSDANYLLVKVKDGKSMYQHLLRHKIVVRDRSNVVLCDNSFRLTVGTEKENRILIQAMKEWSA